MKTKKVLRPQVVAGGKALPLGDNFYYMTGKKHKDGGIDIGKNPNTGIEVEDEEIMHLTDKEVKVFSSVPFLNGESPAQRILQGDSPTKVFNAQQKFKQVNGIKDDGTKKQNGGKIMIRKKYAVGGNKRNKDLPLLPVNNNISLSNANNLNSDLNLLNASEQNMLANRNSVQSATDTPPSTFNKVVSDVKGIFQKGANSVGTFYKENPGSLGDTIGIGSNIIGGLISNRANNKMLDKLQYGKEPVARQAAKLKTNININPQLDRMRETLADYERDVDNNTASSRVALARKQRGRVAGALQTNELYGNKENMETQLINNDKLNQQRVADANVGDYNNWSQGKTAFNNAVIEKRSENTIGLMETLNSGVQDLLTRGERRKATKDNLIAMSAGNPNVNPRILKELGFTSITNKMVEDWEKSRDKKTKKSKK